MIPNRNAFLLGALGGLCASLITWGTLSWFDASRTLRGPSAYDPSASSSANQPLFVYKGQTIAAQQLSAELKIQFERASQQRQIVRRDAELQYFKEVDKIARLFILDKELAARATAEKKSVEDVKAELLTVEQASTDDARGLYEASDPSAPREGFAAVKSQLVEYLNEVRRREALESWTNGLRQSGTWKLLVERPMPLPELSRVSLEGLPSDFKSDQNALVFVDYLCSDCIPFLVEFAKRTEQFRGALRPVYVPFPYTRPEVAMGLARGALCAQQQDGFSAFHMAALTKGDLLSEVSVFDLARQAGLSVGEFRACYRSGEGLAGLMSRAQALARQFGLMQTPALVYRGELLEGHEITKKLDEFLSRESPSGQLTKRDGDSKRRSSSQP